MIWTLKKQTCPSSLVNKLFMGDISADVDLTDTDVIAVCKLSSNNTSLLYQV